MDLICVGDVMLDVHVAADALARGGDVHGRVHVMPGGTSANAAIWAMWAGASAGVVGAVGDDTAGRLLVDALAERGVDVLGVVREEEPTGTMLVVTDAGERSMVADRGASAALRGDHLPQRLEAGGVLVSGYLLLQEPTTPTAVEVLERAVAPLVAVEAASWPLVSAFGPERFFEMTAPASVVLANAEEARALTGEGPSDAAAMLGERYRIAVVKCGAQGALVAVDGVVTEHRPEPVNEIDPTGAGDAFDGVFLGLLARGAQERDAADAACRAGALVASSPSVWPDPGAPG
jgi:sugar/nucleoside kinase (ribokinase family)